ncbi:hypothetical protein CEXT_288711 [Caerostris extrusa]|uniref:Uncharacterized protein n=1 Tax=Caerostris extrusa TaxID=172846 RepID=A0AAV4QGF8_CAEEX|nr:hypothetical protein CEXT_288711 [Caerostris extrusa]
MNVNLSLLRRLAIAYINDLAGLLAQPWAPAPNYYTWMRHMREEVQPQGNQAFFYRPDFVQCKRIQESRCEAEGQPSLL